MGRLAPAAIQLDSYAADLKSALQAAARDQFGWVVPNVASSDFDPAEFGASARRHFRRYLENLGLRLDSLRLQFEGAGLADPAQMERRIARWRHCLELCRDLGVRRAGLTVGGFANESAQASTDEVLKLLADDADRSELQVAILTDDDPAVVGKAIQAIGCPGLAIGLDTSRTPSPAQLSRATPIGAVTIRDARPLGSGFEEACPGEGVVDFPAWLDWLEQAEYQGPLTHWRANLRGDVDGLRRGREYVERLQRRRQG